MSGATCAIFMITNSRMLDLGHRSDARKYGSGQSRHLGGFENPGINVMAFQALECPIFKTFIGGCHADYFHLRRASWASWHKVNVRNGWNCAFEFCQRPFLVSRRSSNELSAADPGTWP